MWRGELMGLTDRGLGVINLRESLWRGSFEEKGGGILRL
jgi:hypothetical protein